MILLLLALVFAQAEPAPGSAVQLSAQAPSAAAKYVGRPVVAVEIFVGGVPSTDPMVADLIETRTGDPLSMATVRETISHIYSLGRYQEVTVDASASGDGVKLRFDLLPIQTVTEIDFRGELGLGEGDLRRAITDRFGAAPSASRAATAAEFLQTYYSDHGYLAAAIRPILEGGARPEEAVLTFEVQAGQRARIREVNVNGDPGETVARFLEKIHASPGRVYERGDIQSRLAEYVRELRQAGHYEAAGTLGSHLRAFLPDGSEVVDLDVRIQQGADVVVRFEGDPLPRNRLDELVPVEREGSVDVDIIEDSEQRIVAYLNQQGYWKASVRSARIQENGRIEIVFTVDRGLLYRIDGDVEVTGNTSQSVTEIRRSVDAIDRVFNDLEHGDTFVRANLDAAAAALAAIYLQRGFAQARVESVVRELAPVNNEGRVRPGITVVEGPRLSIGQITFAGNAAIPSGELQKLLQLLPGAPYFEPNLARAREAVIRAYMDRGFPSVGVELKPVPVEGNRLDLQFAVTEGQQTFIDHVLIVGNVKTRAEVIERELSAEGLRPGQPLSLSALFEARRRLGELGLFRSVNIRQIVHGESATRDLLVEIEEAPAMLLEYGGGLELNSRVETDAEGNRTGSQIELAPRGFFEVGRRNLGGKNRSATLYTRLSLRPDPQEGGSDYFGFADYRVIATYREPKTFGWDADIQISGGIEQGVRSTFSFTRKGINADVVRRLSPTLSASVRYSFSTTRTFDLAFADDEPDDQEDLNIDRLYPQVRLSMFAGTLAHDTRDDQLAPTRAVFVTADTALAARAFGGEVGFVRTYFEGSAYRRISRGSDVVLAGRVGLGLADGFPQEIDTPLGPRIVDDLPASQRFFAGGGTTVRGFSVDSLGTEATLTAGGVPRGGNGLVIGNLEVRFQIRGNLGGALFLDGGNVFNRVGEIDLAELRGAVGFGARCRVIRNAGGKSTSASGRLSKGAGCWVRSAKCW